MNRAWAEFSKAKRKASEASFGAGEGVGGGQLPSARASSLSKTEGFQCPEAASGSAGKFEGDYHHEAAKGFAGVGDGDQSWARVV